MKKFGFISRHEPTREQIEIARQSGIELIPLGDADGFTADISSLPVMDGYIVVHAALAVRLFRAGYPVGVFANANRAPVGAPPTFTAVSLSVYEPLQRRLDWEAMLRLAGGRVESARQVGITDLVSTLDAIADGRITRVRGIGPWAWTLLCCLIGLPEPVIRNGRVVATPRDQLCTTSA